MARLDGVVDVAGGVLPAAVVVTLRAAAPVRGAERHRDALLQAGGAAAGLHLLRARVRRVARVVARFSRRLHLKEPASPRLPSAVVFQRHRRLRVE